VEPRRLEDVRGSLKDPIWAAALLRPICGRCGVAFGPADARVIDDRASRVTLVHVRSAAAFRARVEQASARAAQACRLGAPRSAWSSASRVLQRSRAARTTARARSCGCAEVSESAAGQLITGPRLLIRGALVRDQPGEPPFQGLRNGLTCAHLRRSRRQGDRGALRGEFLEAPRRPAAGAAAPGERTASSSAAKPG